MKDGRNYKVRITYPIKQVVPQNSLLIVLTEDLVGLAKDGTFCLDQISDVSNQVKHAKHEIILL